MPARKKSKSVEPSEGEDFEMVDSSSSKKRNSSSNSKKKQRSESIELVDSDDEGDKSRPNKAAAKKPASKKSKLALDEDDDDGKEVVNVDDEGEEGEDDVFTIERILKHRISEETGKYEYLIRWEGYESEDDTWEPEKNCDNADELLRKYWKNHPTSKQPRKQKENQKKLEKIKSPKKRGAKASDDSEGSEGEIEDAVDLASAENGGSKSKSKTKKRKSPSDQEDEEELAAKQKARRDASERLLLKWNKVDSWEKDVDIVETITQDDDDVLRAQLKLTSGEELWVELRHAYKKCPQAMLAFYESHLRFRAGQDLD